MKELNCSNCPHTIVLISNLLTNEGVYSYVAAVVCITCSQFLYPVFERPSKVLVAPQNAVKWTDALLKGTRSSMGETRRRFAEHKLYPNGLESNGSGGEDARGDPTLPTGLSGS
jgi:hypothetical protein